MTYVRAAALVIGLALATQVHAQTTRCGPEFGQWVCRADPVPVQLAPLPNYAAAFSNAYQEGRSAAADQAAAQALLNAQYSQQAAQAKQVVAADAEMATQRKLFDLFIGDILTGQCDEAEKLAAVMSGPHDSESIRRCRAPKPQ